MLDRPTGPAVLTPARRRSCVTIESGGPGSFWRVVNGCGYTVIGKFCYEDSGAFSCSPMRPGGFGPIRNGGQEGISSGSPGVTWRVSYCDYDEWNRGECSIGDP